ncbi:MAG TPA: hypothetical protein VFK33_15925 [Bacillales bacterium]|nr:hypothetical protein [Bacillales bacterium]
MGWWFLPITFWALGLIFMVGGIYVGHKIGEKKHQLKADAEKAVNGNKDAHVYFELEGRVLDMIPWVTVRLFYLVFGMVVFALGFVALSFVL